MDKFSELCVCVIFSYYPYGNRIIVFDRCQTSREHLIYTVDVAPNLAQRAGHILATVATRTAFYDWELKDLAYKYMRKDIDLLNRRQFDVCEFRFYCIHICLVFSFLPNHAHHIKVETFQGA